MLRKEWSLITNSILIQLAAGLYTYLAAYRQLLVNRPDAGTAPGAVFSGMLLCGPVIFAAMILSLFHLGRPLRAYRAMAHLKTSWLSREVFFTCAFGVLWAASVWMEKSGTAGMNVIWLAAAAGLLSVLSMSGIYAATGKPGWSGLNTALSFFGTLMIFGGVSSTIVMMQAGDFQTWTKASLALAFFILGVRLVYQKKLFSKLAGSKRRSVDQLVTASPLPLPEKIGSMHQLLTLWGSGLSFIGLTLALLILSTSQGHAGQQAWPAVACLTLAGEVLQRIGFNSLGLSNGMNEHITNTK